MPPFAVTAGSPSARPEKRVPGRKHPAEIVLSALLSGRAVSLSDGRTYRLGDDLTLGIGREDEDTDWEMPVADFLRLCARLPSERLFAIGCDSTLAALGAARSRRRVGA